MDINISVLSGRLTKDAELTYTKSGTALTKFSIAVNKRVKQGNEWTDKTSFFNCLIWGKYGEAMSKYLKKGKFCTIQGALEQNRWESEGQKRFAVQIVVNNLNVQGNQKTEDLQNDIPFK